MPDETDYRLALEHIFKLSSHWNYHDAPRHLREIDVIVRTALGKPIPKPHETRKPK